VWPFCLPNPFTSVTVIPDMPISDNASRTSSNLKGLTIAVINFIAFFLHIDIKKQCAYAYFAKYVPTLKKALWVLFSGA
jgi:uncharacterized membrane protein